MNEIAVVCAVICEDHKVLIAQRISKVANGMWEFPGGKVEQNETREAACIREIQEELNVTIQIDRFLCDVIDTAFVPHVHVFAYQAHIIEGEIVLNNHSQSKWIDPKDVFHYPFQEADIKIKDYIQTIKI